MLKIFSDGACSGNPGPGGWAYIILDGETEKVLHEASGYEKISTNNRMELMGPIEALKYLDGLKSPLIITTDSLYVLEGITKWIYSWLRNDWKKGTVKNIELWRELFNLTKRFTIEWLWVKGHSDNVYNNLVDKKARDAIKVLDKKNSS